MCNQSELIMKVEELKEWQALQEEAADMVEALKDFIKREMSERGVEELESGSHICRFTTVLASRFDATSFKREHADLYKEFTKQVTSKRFSIH